MASNKHLLVIDDDRFFTRIVRHQAKASGYSVEEYNDPTMLNPTRLCYFDIIFLDIMMPIINGVQLMNTLRKYAPKAKVVLMTSIDQEVLSSIVQLATEISIDVVGILQKPFKAFEIAEILEVHNIYKNQKSSSQTSASAQDSFPEQAMPNLLDFQPQFLLATGKWAGCEVQVNTPKSNDKSQFPTLVKAHDSNNVPATPINLDVINRGMATIKQVQLTTGISLCLWAQIPAEQLALPEFSERLLAAMKMQDFHHNLLVLELVEPAHPPADSQLARNISQLRAKGVRISIKYVSRDYAETCADNPAYDDIRIGSRLIEAANRSSSGRQLVTNILNRAAQLCIPTTAEGIADSNTYKWLCADGCNFGQGPLIAAAMNVNDLLKWQLSRQPSPRLGTNIYG